MVPSVDVCYIASRQSVVLPKSGRSIVTLPGHDELTEFWNPKISVYGSLD